jgi:hypothetical protein
MLDVFVEGIRARNRGDAIEGSPYPAADWNHQPWREGWRIYDVLAEDPPTDAELLERLARGDLHWSGGPSSQGAAVAAGWR